MVIIHKPVKGVTAAALARFVTRARRAAGASGQVNVLLTSSAAMRGLNRSFRGLDKPTDVLSFPATAGTPKLAGDVAISADIAAANARRYRHSPAQEVKILALHGILHLAGYDHERDGGEMARLEDRLRLALRLSDGLIRRSGSREQRVPARKDRAAAAVAAARRRP